MQFYQLMRNIETLLTKLLLYNETEEICEPLSTCNMNSLNELALAFISSCILPVSRCETGLKEAKSLKVEEMNSGVVFDAE